ncbi:hypothetical protein MTO96_018679 [Rhipicephalus appendiculatus]
MFVDYASGSNERSKKAQVRVSFYNPRGYEQETSFLRSTVWSAMPRLQRHHKRAFNEHLIKDRSMVYESARFHERQQITEESDNPFTTTLHFLENRCDFDDRKECLVETPFHCRLFERSSLSRFTWMAS